MKPSRRRSGDSSSARSGGTIVTWLHMHEKLRDALGLAPASASAPSTARSSRSRSRRRRPRDRGSRWRSAARRAASRPCARRRPRPWRRAACRREPGTRIMSPKQVKITSGSCASAMPSSTRPIGITQTGQPGPVHELDVRRQQVVDAVLVDRVRVPAADLHDLVVAARLDRRQDLAGERAAELGVAELVDELHAHRLAARRASAAPAWTSTTSPGRDGADELGRRPRSRLARPPSSAHSASAARRVDAHDAHAGRRRRRR